MADFASQRSMMVESQVHTADVTDSRLLAAMSAVPRERFVPPSKARIAYMDGCIPLDDGRVLLDPRCFAKLVQLAGIRPQDKVLEVGCGSGYGTAVLSHLASSVSALEENPNLAKIADETLASLGVGNATVIEGNLANGLPTYGPYDVIFVAGAMEERPEQLLAQLSEGGRLVAILREGKSSHARLYINHQGVIGERAAFDALVPVLPGFERQKGFVF